MERYKKMKEWNVIKNLLPAINKHLQLSIQDYDDKYSRESPDLYFLMKVNLLVLRLLNVILQ